jgi:hypothetical protein
VGQSLYESDNWLSDLSVSPRGDRIAFFVHPPVGGDNRGTVAVLDLSGALSTASPEYASLAGLVWDLSGDEVFYTGSITGSRRALFSASTEGKVRAVANVPASLTIHDLSATGQILIGTESTKSGMRGRGSPDAEERELTWLDWPILRDISADGSLILFDEEGDGGGPAYKVFVRKTDGTPGGADWGGYGIRLSSSARWAITRPVASDARFVIQPIGPGGSAHSRIQRPSRFAWFPGRSTVARQYVAAIRRITGFRARPGDGTDGAADTGRLHRAQVSPDGESAFVTSSRGELLSWPVAGGEPQPVPGSSPPTSSWGSPGTGAPPSSPPPVRISFPAMSTRSS